MEYSPLSDPIGGTEYVILTYDRQGDEWVERSSGTAFALVTEIAARKRLDKLNAEEPNRFHCIRRVVTDHLAVPDRFTAHKPV